MITSHPSTCASTADHQSYGCWIQESIWFYRAMLCHAAIWQFPFSDTAAELTDWRQLYTVISDPRLWPWSSKTQKKLASCPLLNPPILQGAMWGNTKSPNTCFVESVHNRIRFSGWKPAMVATQGRQGSRFGLCPWHALLPAWEIVGRGRDRLIWACVHRQGSVGQWALIEEANVLDTKHWHIIGDFWLTL